MWKIFSSNSDPPGRVRSRSKFTDHKYLSISSLQTDYQKPITLQKKIKIIGKEKEKSHSAGDSENKQTKRTPRKCVLCGSKDHRIEKCPKLPKEN